VGLEVDDVLLRDKVAVVTGAAGGIGAAIALGLARFGAHVAICDRDEANLPRTEAVIRATDRDVLAAVLDVRNNAAVDDLFERVRQQFGRVDILVNNVGGTFSGPFEAMSLRGEAAVIAQNFTSVTYFIRKSLELMDDRGGAIINVTSIEAHRAAPGVAVYAAMKAAVMSLTKSLALEFAPRRIRVNCIAPDMIHTEGSLALGAAMEAVSEEAWFQQPWPEEGRADDAAAAAVYLAGDMSRFVTGDTIHLDGGNWASGGWKLHRRGIYVV
jgi:NAD(P)-dependent dehydrogenase (short-subunit alcohol dehydrogenase family)